MNLQKWTEGQFSPSRSASGEAPYQSGSPDVGCCHSQGSPSIKEWSMSSEQESEEDTYQGGQPGDGVCPTSHQFSEVFNSGLRLWTDSARRSIDDIHNDIFRLDQFMTLLSTIPALSVPPRAISFRRDPFTGAPLGLTLNFELQIKTSVHPECDQPTRVIPQKLLLTRKEPHVYRTHEVSHPSPLFPGLSADRACYFTCLTLAWSYILSCRWVEILQQAGEEAILQHQNVVLGSSEFWAMLQRGEWRATATREGSVYYSPWLMKETGSGLQDVQTLPRITPDTRIVFNVVANFCFYHELLNECFVAFAAVIGLDLLERPVPSLPVWSSTAAFNPTITATNRPPQYDRLFELIDNGIMLSCTWAGVESLLCSAFFDPRIPCNLVGANDLGILKALGPFEEGFELLASAISTLHPELALLWVANIWTCQARRAINSALQAMPLSNTVIAVWTGLYQSSLHVQYRPLEEDSRLINRTHEFSTTLFVRADVNEMHVRAPPFGSTMKDNTSIEVRTHLDHNHKLRQMWLLLIPPIGEAVLMEQPRTLECPLITMLLPSLQPDNTNAPVPQHTTSQDLDLKRDTIKEFSESDLAYANYTSSEATSRLFNWQRTYEGGLWLDDGTSSDVEAIRYYQAHPWLENPCPEDSDSESETDKEKLPKARPDSERIIQWRETISTANDIKGF